MHIHEIIKEHAEKRPDAPAIIAPGAMPLSYKALHNHILYVTETLNSMGIGRNSRVAVALPNGPEMAAAFLGISACAACAPLNPGYKADEFDFYLSDLNARALIIQARDDSPARDAALKQHIPVIELTCDRNRAGIFSLHGDKSTTQISKGFANPDDVALVLHTSGTTSRPKIVPLTQTNICTSAHNVGDSLELSPDDLCLNIMPLFHIHGLIGVLLSSIAAGAGVVCTPGFFAPKFFAWIKEFDPTWYSAVPTMHQAILARASQNREIIKNSGLRFIRSCSASLAPSVMADLENIFNVPVIEAYGMTEAAHQMASNPLAGSPRKPGSVGPAAGPEVSVMNERGEFLAQGETGEIVIKGKNITPGYENNPEANETSFTNSWFRTGDQGYLDSDGYLFITGRLKEIINRGGEKISPREIDEILLEHPAVKQVVTFAAPHKQLGEDVAAAIVLKKNTNASEQEIQRFAADKMADFKIPKKVIFLDEIPKGPTGKLQRIGLAEKLGLTEDDFAAGSEKTEFAAPRTETEKKLTGIWSQVLGLDKIGINDHFLWLGGDSILAARIIMQVRKIMRVELSLVDFFNNPTIAKMSGQIEKLEKTMQDGRAPAPLLPTIIPDPNKYLPFPLMDIQQAYWIGRSGIFPLGNVSTHRYMEIDAEKIDLEKFTIAFQKLINRHDMLRSVVLPDGMQQILEHTPIYEIKVLNLCKKTPDQIKFALETVREEMSHQVLPSDQWPIFEIRASKLNRDRYIIHFSLDAMVLDIWSRFIIFTEWEQLYKNPDIPLKKLELSFRDYVLAEHALQDSPQYKRSKEYWLKRLPAMPPAPELPLAISINSIKKQLFKRWEYKLESDIWLKLKRNGVMAGLTPSGMLLAAFADVLKVWCKRPEFTLNLTIYNALPLHPQVNEIVGDFTSLNLLEVDNQKYNSFAKRAKNLQKQFLSNLDHRYFSGLRVLRELSGRQTSSYEATAMPIVFTSALTHGSQGGKQNPTNWIGKTIYSITQTPQVWIDHQVFEESGSLVFSWDALEQLFPDGMIDDMFSAYCSFLKRLAEDESAWHETWDKTAQKLLPQYQIEQHKAVNATETEISDETLHSLFVSQAKLRLKQKAVICSEKTLTYEELYLLSNRIGHRLRKEGVHQDSLIAVVMEKGWEQVAAVLGILASGAAYLPIDPGLSDERLQYLLEYGRVNIVLTLSSLNSLVEWPEGIKRLCVDNEDFAEESAALPKQITAPENLAYVIFTSGSTGAPKGVMIDHQGAVNTILDINRRFSVSSGDKILALSSLTFDLSVYDIFGMLAAGGTIVMPEQTDLRDPSQWAELIEEHKISIWNTVPALMSLFTEYLKNRSEAVGESLRLVLMSGDWIPPNLPSTIKKISKNPQIISLGGATEASIWSILYPIEKTDSSLKSIPYGKPMANQRFYVLNQALAPCPVWVPGMLYIGGAGLAKGYWRDQEKTEKSFITHPTTKERLYVTGDMGRYLPDGNIEFLGREDLQVKIQGYRVELKEIEMALNKHPKIKISAAQAIGERFEEKRLVAYIILEGDSAPSNREFRTLLRKKLPNYMIPTEYIVLDQMPLTENGKTDRKALRSHFKPKTKEKTGTEYSAGDTELIALITSFAEDILETGNISPDDELLNLGATSIHMIRIINRMEQELNFRPEIEEFYANPTIKWLQQAYEEAGTGKGKKRQQDAPDAFIKQIIDKFGFIDDPEEREIFKDAEPGLRRAYNEKKPIRLGVPKPDKDPREKYKKRKSVRSFSADPISLDDFSGFISCIKRNEYEEKPKYLYASAGGLYPVQTYFYIKENRIESIGAGVYYYNPESHSLELLSDHAKPDKNIYGHLVNRPIFEQAAFGIFLITQLRAIVPMYKERGMHYSTIEAGLISQLMESCAPDFGIGLCQIGDINFDKIKNLFDIDETHFFIHSLLGGKTE